MAGYILGVYFFYQHADVLGSFGDYLVHFTIIVIRTNFPYYT